MRDGRTTFVVSALSYPAGGLSPPSFLSRGASAPLAPVVPTPLQWRRTENIIFIGRALYFSKMFLGGHTHVLKRCGKLLY